MTASNIARVGFSTTPTLSGKLLFFCGSNAIGSPVSFPSGTVSVNWTPTDATNYNTASVSVPVTAAPTPTPTPASNDGNSSGTSTLALPSDVTDAVSNAQADLSGATMPSGVTSVILSVTPEAVNPTTGTTGEASTAPGRWAEHLIRRQRQFYILFFPIRG